MLLNIRADVNSLNDTMRNFKESECDFILFILNNVGDEIYKEIKNLGNQKIGIVTQYVMSEYWNWSLENLF